MILDAMFIFDSGKVGYVNLSKEEADDYIEIIKRWRIDTRNGTLYFWEDNDWKKYKDF